MKVADVFGGGGYWSELFGRAVGPTGSVTLVNNAPYWSFSKDDLKTRFADGRLKNVTPRVVETRALDLGNGQVRPDRRSSCRITTCTGSRKKAAGRRSTPTAS